jgi:hypothetical protein
VRLRAAGPVESSRIRPPICDVPRVQIWTGGIGRCRPESAAFEGIDASPGVSLTGSDRISKAHPGHPPNAGHPSGISPFRYRSNVPIQAAMGNGPASAPGWKSETSAAPCLEASRSRASTSLPSLPAEGTQPWSGSETHLV